MGNTYASRPDCAPKDARTVLSHAVPEGCEQ